MMAPVEMEYINARVRGMMAQLITRDRLGEVLSARTLPDWAAAIKDSPYGLEIKPSAASGNIGALYLAVDRTIAVKTHRLWHAAGGRPGMAIAVLLSQWDLDNLLALISGISSRTEPHEILSATLGGGILGPDQLERLAQCSSLKEAADLLTTWGYLHHPAFRSAIGKGTARPPMEMRFRLVEGFYGLSIETAKKAGYRLILTYLGESIDQVNFMTALMWRTLPSDRSPGEFFLHGGIHLSESRYLKVMGSDNVEEAIACISSPRIRTILRSVLVSYEIEGRVSILLQALNRAREHDYSRPLKRDPLGISLVMAYIFLLRREGTLLKLAITRITMDIPEDTFKEMVDIV